MTYLTEQKHSSSAARIPSDSPKINSPELRSRLLSGAIGCSVVAEWHNVVDQQVERWQAHKAGDILDWPRPPALVDVTV
ncbi:hypothetical protein [Sinorhizobium alkalisoli]|uniref:hypothetical protein n=1 Tax=Sinorhizobium alkalisoli TaxID=1752398 RepID=UPI00124DD497|nr:hypothetical protein [Sinorhizobium alkalisoli]